MYVLEFLPGDCERHTKVSEESKEKKEIIIFNKKKPPKVDDI